MNFLRSLRVLWLAGALAFVLAELQPLILADRPLHGAATATRPDWHEGGFVSGGAYWDVAPGRLPARIATIGSWVDSDEWQGEAQTRWMRVTSDVVRVCVAGYPQLPGCSLRAEFRLRDGTLATTACDLPNPQETWQAWDINVPSGARELRLVAEDRTSVRTGWLAFSEPFATPSNFSRAAYQSAQVLATLALVLGLLWLPGLCCIRFAVTPELRAAVLLGAGPLVLVLAGLAMWLLGGLVRPPYVAPACLWTGWTLLGLALWRRPQLFAVSAATQRTLALAALCALAATAKSTFSGGPEGELFRGDISRTLAVGNRGDSRTSYFVVQIVARHLSPASAEAEQYFTPWTFFSRGPLSGLAATPVVFATGGRPPSELPNEAWQPFDPRGFAAYRIVMIALASMIVVALFAALVPFAGEPWALIGAALFALSPFAMHETMFTWPKLVATAWLLVSFLFAHRDRPFLGGAALTVGYLFHPLTLLWAPWLALWTVARATGSARTRLGRGAWFAAGILVLIAPWMAAGRLPAQLPGSNQAGQGGFIQYFTMADWAPATVSSWLLTRWQNFANTFLPFWLYAVNASLRDLNSVYAPAGPLVKFAFSWWNTLPLGLGLGLWAGGMTALWQSRRRLGGAIALLFVAPALLLTAYWGASPTGLMRESGHPLHVAVIGLAIVWLATTRGRLASLVAHRAAPWCQLPELFLMLWLTTFANPHPPQSALAALDPLWFTVNIAALVAIALLAARARENLPSSSSPARAE